MRTRAVVKIWRYTQKVGNLIYRWRCGKNVRTWLGSGPRVIGIGILKKSEISNWPGTGLTRMRLHGRVHSSTPPLSTYPFFTQPWVACIALGFRFASGFSHFTDFVTGYWDQCWPLMVQVGQICSIQCTSLISMRFAFLAVAWCLKWPVLH